MNYGREMPRARNDIPYPAPTPAFTSLQSQSGVPTASSVLTFNSNTTVLQITAMSGTAGSGGIIGKWGSASVTGTNYDLIVQSGLTATYLIPVSIAGVSSNVGANVANGLYSGIALKTATAQSASVFTAEF